MPPIEADRVWLKSRLSPLVGAGGEQTAQEESFTAWRRFCESLAAESPAVLVFEDLHWADTALLAFLEHMAEWSEGVPLLVLCTARPELYERHSHFGAEARNAQRINLAPLSDKETASLISSLLDQAVLDAETQQALLERAGGNPLYAEEFVRLLADRDLPAGSLEDIPVPDSVQALIAARLDTLAAERKSLLQDAAVVGQEFWAGALQEMGGGREQRDVDVALHELARKELVRPARTSSMQGEAEYAFWHVLVRDVCYAQIPRAGRAARHRAAAAWIEQKAGERAEDLADVLAHHFVTALELTRDAGAAEETQALEASARHYLALAGDRALALDVASAEASLARALELAPADHPERAGLLERWAQAAQQQGRLQEARAALDDAIALYRERAEGVAAGRALTALSILLSRLGAGRSGVIGEAIALLEAEPPGPELVAAYAELAGVHVVRLSAYREGVSAAERALELAAELRLPEPARALGFRGLARALLGERQGLGDLRRALALSIERGMGRDAGILYVNLADSLWLYDGPEAALSACRDGLEFCKRRGIREVELALGAESLLFRAVSGHPEAALLEAEPLATRAEAAGDVALIEARSEQLLLLAERGEAERAAVDANDLAAAARETGELQQIALAFAAAVPLLFAQGRRDAARELLVELEQTPSVRAEARYYENLPGLVRCALALPDRELAGRLVEGREPRTPLDEGVLSSTLAALAEAGGDLAAAAERYAEAAQRWQQFGHLPERAYALLGQGRCLVALGRPAAEQPLSEAREVFTALGYDPALAETEVLLGQAEAAPL